MKVGFTGTQAGMTLSQYGLLLLTLRYNLPEPMTEFHHGDCVGADAQAHELVRKHFKDTKIVVHPPSNPYKRAFKEGDETRPALEYIQRNRWIVIGTDILVAAPKELEEQQRSGTWSTVRFAQTIGRTVIIVPHVTDELKIIMPV